jgi:hypothetical protein
LTPTQISKFIQDNTWKRLGRTPTDSETKAAVEAAVRAAVEDKARVTFEEEEEGIGEGMSTKELAEFLSPQVLLLVYGLLHWSCF